MGGAVRGGNVTRAAEFNLWSDPEAAHRVLVTERVPTVLVPLDLTMRCVIDTPWLDRLAASGRIGRTLVGLAGAYRDHYRLGADGRGMVLHDALALAEVIRPGILRTTAHVVDVACAFGPTRGSVAAAEPAEVPSAAGHDRVVDIALDADLDELRAFLLGRLSG